MPHKSLVFSSPRLEEVALKRSFSERVALPLEIVFELSKRLEDAFPRVSALTSYEVFPGQEAESIPLLAKDLPGCQFQTRAGDITVVIQDRGIFGRWTSRDNQPYPGYEALASLTERAVQELALLQGREPAARVVQLLYANVLESSPFLNLHDVLAAGWLASGPDHAGEAVELQAVSRFESGAEMRVTLAKADATGEDETPYLRLNFVGGKVLLVGEKALDATHELHALLTEQIPSLLSPKSKGVLGYQGTW